MQRYNSVLVMLESHLHISFCVRALIVFVCPCRQTNCRVVWRTRLPPQPPSSPLCVSQTFLQSTIARTHFAPRSATPLCVRHVFSRCPSSPLCPLTAGRLLFCLCRLLHDLLETSCRLRCVVSQFQSSFSNPSP